MCVWPWVTVRTAQHQAGQAVGRGHDADGSAGQQLQVGLAARAGDHDDPSAGVRQLVAQAGDGVAPEVGVQHRDVRGGAGDQLPELLLGVGGVDLGPELLGERGGHPVGDDG